MNKVYLIGRLCADPEIRYSQGENSTAIARYRLAVNRRFKREGDPEADFIGCVAFGKNGEFAEKYLHKGMRIAVCGRIQTGSYEKDGQRVYTTDIIVEEHEFVESKSVSPAGSSDNTQNHASAADPSGDGFMDIPYGIDEELPFN